MSQITRRQLLTFFGATAAASALGAPVGRLVGGGTAEAAWPGDFTPVRMPHPLPVYADRPSYLATGIDTGMVLAAAEDPSLDNYTVIDDVVVPPEFERYVVLQWGERIFPDPAQYVGYNHDYTAFIADRHAECLLWVNHEYVSFPFSALSPAAPPNLAGSPTTFQTVIGFPFPSTLNREALGEMLYNSGGTIARLKLVKDHWKVVRGDASNRRIHGLSGLAINADRVDAYRNVTAWGPRDHQAGDGKYLVGTGPAAVDVFPRSVDGLGNRIIGTSFNCSGATTPWGTVMSAEENFQGSSLFFVGVTEDVKPDGTQTGYVAGTTGAHFGLVGEKYGWLVEIDPRSHGIARKHTALGRFRHENIALRAEQGRPLVAYMGDDRRGGHVWRFVSRGLIRDSKSKTNSQLLEDGTLYVARFEPDGTGRWIPVALTTPTNPLAPSVVASEEIAALGSAQQNGRVKLPRRAGIAGQTADGGAFNLELANEAAALPQYQNKTVGHFYPTLGAVLVDAFLAGNLVGGTPCARPEDIEINPRNTREVIIAMTDGAPGSDGYPDSRIFVVAKYTADVDGTQQSGSLHKIIEEKPDGSSTTFRWERLAQGGEAGCDEGLGFANVDNLAFDQSGNLWCVSDITTNLHNGFGEGAMPAPVTIDHRQTGNVANLVGVFGNNMLFTIPLNGHDAGALLPFAYGPVRCEMTGPTFVGDQLIISVQHPSEDVPIGTGSMLSRALEMLKLDGSLFTQQRTVPGGSNWPGNVTGDPVQLPRPATIAIRRKR